MAPAANAPEAATAGIPIPGFVESPHRYSPKSQPSFTRIEEISDLHHHHDHPNSAKA